MSALKFRLRKCPFRLRKFSIHINLRRHNQAAICPVQFNPRRGLITNPSPWHEYTRYTRRFISLRIAELDYVIPLSRCTNCRCTRGHSHSCLNRAYTGYEGTNLAARVSAYWTQSISTNRSRVISSRIN